MPKNKKHNPYFDYAVYMLVRVLVCVVQALPLIIAIGFGEWFAWIIYRVDKRHREIARDNLKNAFPELRTQPRKCERLVRNCYMHFVTMMVEIAVLPRRIHLYNWRRSTATQGFERLVAAVLSGRPVMVVTAHFGNWEAAGYVSGVVGLKSFAIARVLDNPHLDRFLQTFRQKTGQTILSKTGDFERITAALETRSILSTLGDQDAGPKGLFVDFFNRPASTHKAVALLALQYDALMVVFGVPRIGTPMKFLWWIEDVIDTHDYAGRRGTAVKAITIRFTQAIERMVRQYPEQYFWLHRRWKHQPPVRVSIANGAQQAVAESGLVA
jgi:Kdo2-lipid IVA lauroyltransferase/acyltransferase